MRDQLALFDEPPRPEPEAPRDEQPSLFPE